MYSPNCSTENKIFCLSLHYNGNNSFLYVNGKTVTQFKAKDSEIISSNTYLSEDDIESGKLYGNIYNFSVNYEQIGNKNILDIHTYLMKKTILYK